MLFRSETSGYDVLREMALRGTAKALPVIVLTAYPEVRNEDERRLLEQGLVLEILAKTDIHSRPRRLMEAIEGHLSSIAVFETGTTPRLEVERFHAEVPEGEALDRQDDWGVEHRFDAETGNERLNPPAEQTLAGNDDEERRAA